MKKLAIIIAAVSVISACQSTEGLVITKKDGMTTAVPNTAPKHSLPADHELKYAPQVSQNAAETGNLMIFFEPSAKADVLEMVKRRGDELIYSYENFNGIAIRPMYHTVDSTISAYQQLKGVLSVQRDTVHKIGLPTPLESQ